MKALILFAILFSFSSQAFWARECSNSSSNQNRTVSFQWTNCLRDNFWQVETRLNMRRGLDRCDNFPNNRVSPFYAQCVNKNFDQISFKLRGAFLRHCFQFDRNELEPRFIDCVNENFEEIERELRFRR
jgi:hypothetical protein